MYVLRRWRQGPHLPSLSPSTHDLPFYNPGTHFERERYIYMPKISVWEQRNLNLQLRFNDSKLSFI
jgi:hypothetical protein